MSETFFKRRKKGICGKDPEDIGVLLQIVLDKNHITEEMALKDLLEGFKEIVGPLIFPHVKIEKLDKQILTLKCESSVWKQELFLQKKAIIDKCNLMLGKPLIKGIHFV